MLYPTVNSTEAEIALAESYNAALAAITTSDYHCAHSVLERCVAGTNSPPLRLRYLVDLGYTQRELALCNHSKATLSEALALAKQVSGENSLDVVNVCVELARTLAILGEYREAELYSSTARRIISIVPEKMRSNTSIQRLCTAAADCAATILRLQGKYKSALCILRRELRQLRHREELTLDYALFLNHCGMLCKYLRRFKAANVFYQRALSIQELCTPRNTKNIADIYYNLGGLEHAANPSGEKRFGVIYARRALRQRLKVFGGSHPDTALALSMIAANLILRGSYQRAEVYTQRSIKIQREMYGDTHRDIAMNLNHLGTISYAVGAYHDARELFEKAVAMKAVTVGGDHPDLIVVLYNLLRAKQKLWDRSHYTTLKMQFERLCEAHPELVIEQYRQLLRTE